MIFHLITFPWFFSVSYRLSPLTTMELTSLSLDEFSSWALRQYHNSRNVYSEDEPRVPPLLSRAPAGDPTGQCPSARWERKIRTDRPLFPLEVVSYSVNSAQEGRDKHWAGLLPHRDCFISSRHMPQIQRSNRHFANIYLATWQQGSAGAI